jgi:hypothetical protein
MEKKLQVDGGKRKFDELGQVLLEFVLKFIESFDVLLFADELLSRF